MKDDMLPLHTNSLACGNAWYLKVPTKVLEAADVSSSESQTLQGCVEIVKQQNSPESMKLLSTSSASKQLF